MTRATYIIHTQLSSHKSYEAIRGDVRLRLRLRVRVRMRMRMRIRGCGRGREYICVYNHNSNKRCEKGNEKSLPLLLLLSSLLCVVI